MQTLKKLALTGLLVAAVVTVSVLGTLAWLTDRESVTNVFTVGNVDIRLDEAAVDSEGTPIADADRVTENQYHLLPGMTYTKDPTLTVVSGSEESYVRMLLTVHNASGVQALIDAHALGDFSAFLGGWDQAVWQYQAFTENTAANTITFEFRYHTTAPAVSADTALEPLFTTLIVPGALTGQELEALYDGGFQMVVEGHAIQAAAMEDADAAWAAFRDQWGQSN